MILTQEEKTAIAVGNIQQNTVGIDAKNVNFITSLLTEKLYSKPIQSFLREIVSNAYDSHTEANSDEPVLIRITNGSSKEYIISVRDYGTGLSPERFDLIYKNIGSSTKRESNDYIGQLGIGRFAALSVSNRCNIISYYNGTKDIYLMYKDEGTVHIDKLSSIPTKEPNGIEVSVHIEREYRTNDSISEGIKDLAFFDKIYVQNETPVPLPSRFNERIIKKYTHFAYLLPYEQNNVCFNTDEISTYRDYKILYGDVLYPLSFKGINNLSDYYIPRENFYLKFDIGELDITPSREFLQMTAKTVKAIENKLKNYWSELLDIINNKFGEIDNVGKILDCIEGTRYSSLFKVPFDSVNKKNAYFNCDTSLFGKLFKDKKLVLSGKDHKIVIPELLLKLFLNDCISYKDDLAFNYKYKYSYRKLHKVQDSISLRTFISLLNNNSVFICREAGVSAIIDWYLKSRNNEFIVTTKKHEKDMIKSFLNSFSLYEKDTRFAKEETGALKKDVAKWYYSKRILISKKELPKESIDAWNLTHKKEKVEKKEANKDEIIFWGFHPSRQSFTKLSLSFVMKAKIRNRVYVFDKNSAYIPIVQEMMKGFIDSYNSDTIYLPEAHKVLCAVAQKNLTACQKLGLFTETDFLSSQNPFMKKLAAILLWVKRNDIQRTDVSALSYFNASLNFLISKDRISELITTAPIVRKYFNGENATLTEALEDSIKNYCVDWSFYSKLPTKEEMSMIKFMSKCGSQEELRSLWAIELMRRKLVPLNARNYRKFKQKINERIEGGW